MKLCYWDVIKRVPESQHRQHFGTENSLMRGGAVCGVYVCVWCVCMCGCMSACLSVSDEMKLQEILLGEKERLKLSVPGGL